MYSVHSVPPQPIIGECALPPRIICGALCWAEEQAFPDEVLPAQVSAVRALLPDEGQVSAAQASLPDGAQVSAARASHGAVSAARALHDAASAAGLDDDASEAAQDGVHSNRR